MCDIAEYQLGESVFFTRRSFRLGRIASRGLAMEAAFQESARLPLLRAPYPVIPDEAINLTASSHSGTDPKHVMRSIYACVPLFLDFIPGSRLHCGGALQRSKLYLTGREHILVDDGFISRSATKKKGGGGSHRLPIEIWHHPRKSSASCLQILRRPVNGVVLEADLMRGAVSAENFSPTSPGLRSAFSLREGGELPWAFS